MKLLVAARDSPLSKIQVEEVLLELQKRHPHLLFDPIFVKTTGDRDKKTSLRTLEKTDFFTKEIDEMVLTGVCRMGIHSAKDLPEPLPQGLKVIYLSAGLDPSDSLVLRQGESLRSGMTIATSSLRREECVRLMQEDIQFVDVRGTIDERLALLDAGKVDGVVIAEAALIRLKLTHLHRLKLPGETAPLQGKLACVARVDDGELLNIVRAS